MSEPTPDMPIITLRMPQVLIDEVDAWRASQLEPPSRTIALRTLIRMGLRVVKEAK